MLSILSLVCGSRGFAVSIVHMYSRNGSKGKSLSPDIPAKEWKTKKLLRGPQAHEDN